MAADGQSGLTREEHDTLERVAKTLEHAARHDNNVVTRFFGNPSNLLQTVILLGGLLWGVFEVRAVATNTSIAVAGLSVKVDRMVDRQADVVEQLGRHDERIRALEASKK